MIEKYNGIPKKLKIFADDSGNTYKLGKNGLRTDAATRIVGSGTLLNAGHLTVTGTYCKPDSFVFAIYNNSSAYTSEPPLSVELDDGSVTFYGEGDAKFYFMIIN